MDARTPTHNRLSAHSVLQRIGHTPLCRLERIGSDFRHVRFLFKAEWYNPSGSVKDRSAYRMIRDAVRRGDVSGRILLDASSGNHGSSVAMVAAALGYRVRICVPATVTCERLRLLEAYGAELTLTDGAEGSDGAIRAARELFAQDPERYCYLDQYSNDSNWKAHCDGTGEEIWRQTRGTVTHFIAGVGSSGTFTGVARRLRAHQPAIQCIAVHPDVARHGLRGMKHMASALVPAIYDPAVADLHLTLSTEAAHEMVRRVAREEGLMIGVTSGAVLTAALDVAARLHTPATLVMIFADSADRYLSEAPVWRSSVAAPLTI
jgi:S-sulfo-L-cysteine synthase (O-acetyl-L-serine-dependent)